MKFIFGVIKAPFFLIYKLLRWIGKAAISFISITKNIIVKICKRIQKKLSTGGDRIDISIDEGDDEQSPWWEDFISVIIADAIYFSIFFTIYSITFLCGEIYKILKKRRA